MKAKRNTESQFNFYYYTSDLTFWLNEIALHDTQEEMRERLGRNSILLAPTCPDFFYS